VGLKTDCGRLVCRCGVREESRGLARGKEEIEEIKIFKPQHRDGKGKRHKRRRGAAKRVSTNSRQAPQICEANVL